LGPDLVGKKAKGMSFLGGSQDIWKERRGMRGGEGGEEDRGKGRQVNFSLVNHRNPSFRRSSDGSIRNLPPHPAPPSPPPPYGFPWDVQKKSPPHSLNRK